MILVAMRQQLTVEDCRRRSLAASPVLRSHARDWGERHCVRGDSRHDSATTGSRRPGVTGVLRRQR